MEWLLYIAIVISLASIIVARNARAHAKLALQESRKAIAAKEEAEEALIHILDADGNVRGRLALPGEVPKPPPTKTPCGDLCKHSFFIHDNRTRNSGTWNCGANQGIECPISRPLFLDETNNCVMFERDDD